MQVFVFLGSGLDAGAWRQSFAQGRVPDASPYGYHHADDGAVRLTFSRPTEPRGLWRKFDGLCERVLGFRLLHAFHQWSTLRSQPQDVIWTHTERESLPMLFMLRLWPAKKRPKMIAQTVWMVDHWPKLSWLQRRLARWLLNDAQACTFLSPDNAKRWQALGYRGRVDVVPFGIADDFFPAGQVREQPPEPARALRVLAVGNDGHRDWITFGRALLGDARFEIRVASSTFPGAQEGANWKAGSCPHRELASLYEWCDVVVVPLTHNLHASGITTVLEAVRCARPVLATDVGGLTFYFGDHEIGYCRVGDAEHLRSQLLAMREQWPQTIAAAQRAQARLLEHGYTTQAYARRHVALSRELLNATPARPRGPATQAAKG